MKKEYYYLYVYSVDMCGTHELIKGKLFFDKDIAIDNAKKYCSVPGYHSQIISGTTILYNV